MRILAALFLFTISLLPLEILAQQGQRPNMEQRVENEKSRVLEKVTDLTGDQKLIFDQIYAEYGQALKDAFAASSGNFQGAREKMAEIRKNKDEALKEVLNETQYTLYSEVMESQRQNRRGGGQGREGRASGNNEGGNQ